LDAPGTLHHVIGRGIEGAKLDNLIRDPRVCFEVDVPLAYLKVDFNPDKNPCRTHQIYHSVIIRGSARVVPNGELKTTVLNALVAKHEGNRDFTPVTSDSTGYKTCWDVGDVGRRGHPIFPLSRKK
jgi:nitroimidazol reductase NimA-like FMN-containing flavoprotein (pyridoxamine 5'-phosphate oxidase superfamily)